KARHIAQEYMSKRRNLLQRIQNNSLTRIVLRPLSINFVRLKEDEEYTSKAKEEVFTEERLRNNLHATEFLPVVSINK
ncbi:646_t:CDS:2, partial [Scutellospora calospora]